MFPVMYDRILLTQEFNGMLENVCVLARRFEYRPMKISKQSIIMDKTQTSSRDRRKGGRRESEMIGCYIGETADEIFYEAETEALDVDDKDAENREELYDSHDQKTTNAETQTPESRVQTQNAVTQPTGFEYLFKHAVLQPFTEEYFANVSEVLHWFAGL